MDKPCRSLRTAKKVEQAVPGFWHTVLWFVDSDFTGWSMVVYIISNVAVMTALNVIMSCMLERHNNLATASGSTYASTSPTASFRPTFGSMRS